VPEKHTLKWTGLVHGYVQDAGGFYPSSIRSSSPRVELYMHYLKCDSRLGEIDKKPILMTLQAHLESIENEHGDTYGDSIRPIFDPLKSQHFDSSWNWLCRDAL
jgi:hypothetical protein